MYLPINDRLTKLETHRDDDNFRLVEMKTDINAANHKLDRLINSRIELTTALWGHDGKNGLRSRLVKLEEDVEVLKFKD